MFYTNKVAAYEKINDVIKSGGIMCMREIGRNGVVGKIIGVSYTEEGLRGIANKSSKYPYSGVNNIKDAYKAPKASNIKVEKFIPSDIPSKEEVLWIDKSYRLLNIR
jgi:hypothetical protein